MSKFSVKRPYVVLVVVLALTVLGIAGFTKMTTDFLPEMELPYMVVTTTYTGASPQKVESELTDPIENSLATINGVKNVNSTSSENYSMVTLEFEDGTNMDSAMVKVTSALNQIEMPEGVGDPMIMEISMDMMPTLYTSIDYDGKDGSELTQYVNDNILPEIKRQDGVASVQTMGMIEDSVEVKFNQDKIDEVNKKILETTDSELSKAKKKLTKAEKKLEKAEAELEKQKKNLEDKQDSSTSEMAKYTKMLNEAIATKAGYEAEYQSIKSYITVLKMEKKAYTGKNGVKSMYDAMNTGFKTVRESFKEGGAGYKAMYENIYSSVLVAAVQSAYKAMGDDVTITAKNVDTYLKKLPNETEDQIKGAAKTQATTLTKTQCKTTLNSLPTSVKDAIDNPDKLKAYKKILEQQGQKKAAKQMTKKNLQKMYNIVKKRLPEVKSALATLKVQKIAAKKALEMVSEQIDKATDNYEEVEKGKMTASIAFGSGQAGITSGEGSLKSSKQEIKNAKKSFENSKEAALDNANLDKLLTLETLSGILTAQNFSMPAGYINDDKTQYLLKIDESEKTEKDIANTLLTKIKKVGDIRLKDVADIVIINNSDEVYAKVNGNDAVVLAVYKSSSAGTSSVSKAVNAKINELDKKNSKLHFTNLMDQGEYIKIIIKSIFSNLLWGALFAIIVLFFFLKDIRPTAVVAFAIPLSVLFAILLMYFTDITMNIISLSGLALGIGMLVDNSVVVIENIYRLRAKGIGAARAAVMGANQVAGAIFASTLTTICVFLPIVFTDGLTRQIIQDMCLTITYSLVASLAVALTVVPALGSTLLKKNINKEHRWFDAVLNGYDKVLRFCLGKKWVPILISVALLLMCAVKVFTTGIVMIPEMGSTQLSASIDANPETDMAEDIEIIDAASKEIGKIKGVEKVGSVQASSLGFGNTSNKNYQIMLLLEEKYSHKNKEIAKKIEKILSKEDFKNVEVSESSMDSGSMLGSGLSVEITGDDDKELLRLSEEVMNTVKKNGGYENISNGQEGADKEVILDIDKDKAMRKGLTVAQICQEIAGKLTTEKQATTINVDGDILKVNVNNEVEQLELKKLLDYEIPYTKTKDDGTQEEKKVKLGKIASYSIEDSVASISHKNGTKVMNVSAEVKDGENNELLTRKLEPKINKIKTGKGYKVKLGGENESTDKMIKNMLLMMLVALILIYLIMVGQFQNFLSPFIVMFTIPLAFTGGFIALMISGEFLSMLSLMGFLILMGVVVNNGIVFIDYANQLRIGGMEKREALVETGKTRMRPILMTALTTVLGMTVMAFSKGQGSEMGHGMAIVVIGGLTYATLMTLFIVPVLYDIFYRKKEMKAVDLGDEDTLNAREGEEVSENVGFEGGDEFAGGESAGSEGFEGNDGVME
ncbi:MAG: efflux RND transporter permease subunit [Lachnospiraceae bacterium]|nr:efflux RND transporter permease subunit [Lachnospiraceae bacterium]